MHHCTKLVLQNTWYALILQNNYVIKRFEQLSMHGPMRHEGVCILNGSKILQTQLGVVYLTHQQQNNPCMPVFTCRCDAL